MHVGLTKVPRLTMSALFLCVSLLFLQIVIMQVYPGDDHGETSECIINNVLLCPNQWGILIYPKSDTCSGFHVLQLFFCKFTSGPDTASRPRCISLFTPYLPRKPTFKFLLCFCLFVRKLITLTAETRGSSIKGERRGGRDGVECV